MNNILQQSLFQLASMAQGLNQGRATIPSWMIYGQAAPWDEIPDQYGQDMPGPSPPPGKMTPKQRQMTRKWLQHPPSGLGFGEGEPQGPGITQGGRDSPNLARPGDEIPDPDTEIPWISSPQKIPLNPQDFYEDLRQKLWNYRFRSKV